MNENESLHQTARRFPYFFLFVAPNWRALKWLSFVPVAAAAAARLYHRSSFPTATDIISGGSGPVATDSGENYPPFPSERPELCPFKLLLFFREFLAPQSHKIIHKIFTETRTDYVERKKDSGRERGKKAEEVRARNKCSKFVIYKLVAT